MNEKAVYAKTSAGQREIGERKAGLDIRQRRLLILVDGQRNVSELRAVSGFPDTPALLDGLQVLGLVVAAGGASTATVLPAAAAAGDVRERGRRAARAISDLLGPMGEELAMGLEEVKSADALESLLSRCRKVLAEFRGKSALERFESLLEEDA